MTISTQLVDIADIPLQPIQIENDSAAVSEKTVKSQELWADGPVLIQLVRRPVSRLESSFVWTLSLTDISGLHQLPRNRTRLARTP